jgi:outer membrane protein TolC
MIRNRTIGGAIAVALVAAAPRQATGQDSPRDAIVLARRPLAELIAELPGRAVSLADLRDVALERSLPLESARTRRRLADASVDVEAGDFDLALRLDAGFARSRFLPDRTGSYQARLDQVLPWGTEIGLALTGTQSPADVGPGDTYDADLGVAFRQPLLEGFRTRDTELRVARLLREASVHRLARALATVVADVEVAYWDLAEAEATQAVLQRSYEIAQALLVRNEELAGRQIVAEVDVITARSGVALRRATLVDARRARIDASEAVVFIAWGETAVGELVRDTLPVKTVGADLGIPSVLSLADEVGLALDRRGDLAAARADLRGAEVAASGTQNARLPLLNMEGYVRTGGSQSSLSGSLGALDQASSWSLGLSFVQPLRNRTDRGLDQIAVFTHELRRLDLVAVENLVRQDVREAVRAILAGEERLEAAEEAAALAAAQLEAERRRLDLGLGDSFRLLETEENAVQAELESVQARYDLARAVTLYRLASGELGSG